jgi:hypothetical protein
MVSHPNRSKKYDAVAILVGMGFSHDDAAALRRISMQLRRWYELECGVEGGGVERDEATGKCSWYSSNPGRRTPYPDRETGAVKRLDAIMKRYAPLAYYLQTDPRGAALYIMRPGDVPEGQNVESYYTRGIVVY